MDDKVVFVEDKNSIQFEFPVFSNSQKVMFVVPKSNDYLRVHQLVSHLKTIEIDSDFCQGSY